MYTATGLTDKEQCLREYAPLVKRIAHHLKARLPGSVEVDDIIQAGMMGLLEAANRYDELRGAQFETYAAQRIRGAMLDELRQADWMPRNFDWRVEALVPIENETVHRQVLDEIMVHSLQDEAQSWQLDAEGVYHRVSAEGGFSAHTYFMTNPSLSGRGRARKKDAPVPQLTLKKRAGFRSTD